MKGFIRRMFCYYLELGKTIERKGEEERGERERDREREKEREGQRVCVCEREAETLCSS